jgi:serine/threonine protein kinase
VGRRSDEVLRVLAALESGGMCPEDWCVDCDNLDPTQVLHPGSRISHYRIESEVGRGTFAAVFRAFDLTLRRDVALKVFRPGGPATAADILSEARTAAALSHPNICTIFSVDDSEGALIIAMEFVDGRPLSAILQDGGLPGEKTSQIGRQIALGMAAAHRMGIVHSDLKPANILLTQSGDVKITDFGLARRTRPNPDSGLTLEWESSEAKISGTPSYMSPEQTRGEPASPASDVFSFGLLLYEMLTGRMAFLGQNVLQVLDMIRDVEPERLAAEVPERFSPILRRALEPNVQERVITMEEVARLLE